MGIETLLDISEVEIKSLLIFQSVASGIFIILLIFNFIFLMMDGSEIEGREKNIKREIREKIEKSKKREENEEKAEIEKNEKNINKIENKYYFIYINNYFIF